MKIRFFVSKIKSGKPKLICIEIVCGKNEKSVFICYIFPEFAKVSMLKLRDKASWKDEIDFAFDGDFPSWFWSSFFWIILKALEKCKK
jgi:hypothetical protein